MKKTLSIHLGRQLFVIEEDAFDRLQQYLQRLEQSLKGETGVADIVEDIEMRFAELLLSYLGETRKVVTIDDVEKGIASLGEPEMITEETQETTSEQQNTREQSQQTYGGRKFFRDTDNGMIGGVAAGLAAYLNIDPVIARIIFILMGMIGFGVPLYIILWVIAPNASTPSERLQMHGKAVTVESLKEEFVKAADRIKDDTKRARDRFRSGNDPVVQRARNVTRLIAKLIGIGMIGFASVFLILFTLTTSGIIDVIPTTGDEEYTSLHDMLRIVSPVDDTFTLMWSGILLVGFAGSALFILLGTRLLIGKPTRFLRLSLITLPVLIAIGMVLGLVSGLQTGRDFAVYPEVMRQHLTTNANQLTIEEMPHYYNNQRVLSSRGVDFIHIRNGMVTEQGVMITYRASKDTLFHVYQIVTAHGVDHESASKRCTHIRNTVQLLGEKLVVDPMVSYPASDGFRGQEVEVVIEVPRDKKLLIKDFEVVNPIGEERGALYPNEPFNPWKWD